jgi:hypothetical protein
LPEGWFGKDFDDSAWKKGPSGFGTPETPGAVLGTPWSGSEIAIRRSFTLSQNDAPTHLVIHHDEDADVYIDGVKIASLAGYTTGYGRVELSPHARALLTPGEHVIAIRCVNTSGGQFIDAGFVRVVLDSNATKPVDSASHSSAEAANGAPIDAPPTDRAGAAQGSGVGQSTSSNTGSSSGPK